jgi:DNA/RNA-binding protein KIN17
LKRDPAILAQQENYKRRVDAEKREEAKLAKRMELQRVEAAKLLDRAGISLHVEASSMDRSEGSAPIALKLGISKHKPEKKAKKKSIIFNDDGDDDEEEKHNQLIHRSAKNGTNGAPPSETQHVESRKRKVEKMSEDRDVPKSARLEDSNKTLDSSADLEDIRKKNWIRKDILVRIITKRQKYYKRKAVINKVYDKYTAEVEILDSGPDVSDGGDIVEFDQEELETVIPKIGKKVMVVNGRGRGMKAILISTDDERCRGKLELSDGIVLKKVEYDDFSKFSS